MSVPHFADHRTHWAQLPVDDVGYLYAEDLLASPDDNLRLLIKDMERVRYDPGGFRNYRNLWRATLGLDSTHGKRVLDYGCGTGIEALQYARAGNRVWLADLTRGAVLLAQRVLRLYGYEPAGTSVIDEQPPLIWFPDDPYDFDVVHMAGVLHHVWNPRMVVGQVYRWLAPEGELRLMLYSEHSWGIAVGNGQHPPPDEPSLDPRFSQFVRYMDGVGGYADWYSPERLVERFGDLFTLERAEYLAPDRRFLAAVLRRKETG